MSTTPKHGLLSVQSMTEAELLSIETWAKADYGVEQVVTDLIAEVRRLRAALRKYGWHQSGPDGCQLDPCTCGFDAALKVVEDAEGGSSCLSS